MPISTYMQCSCLISIRSPYLVHATAFLHIKLFLASLFFEHFIMSTKVEDRSICMCIHSKNKVNTITKSEILFFSLYFLMTDLQDLFDVQNWQENNNKPVSKTAVAWVQGHCSFRIMGSCLHYFTCP